MSLSEFELIERYFKSAFSQSLKSSISVGIGDDAALFFPTPGQQGCICTDVLVSDVHFPANADSFDIAQRALRVNLSDLAAMGARPVCFTLGLTLPHADEDWISRFGGGLFSAASAFDCPLVGGDTTRGPLNISITVYGEVPAGEALQRAGAQAGDNLYVTGQLGKGKTALNALGFDSSTDDSQSKESDMTPEQISHLYNCFYRPEPRLAFAAASRRLISSAIDISDGLYADSGHLARASGLALQINAHELPFDGIVTELTDPAQRVDAALFGGDDYELAFTAAPGVEASLFRIASELDLAITCIGSVSAGTGVTVQDEQGIVKLDGRHSFDHFKGSES